jgi:hypothetical protein
MTEPVDRPRQSRIKCPTAKLTDLNNLQQPALSFQRAAVEAERVRLQQDVDPPSQPNSSLPPSSPFAASTGSTRPTSPIVTERSSEQPASAGGKRPFVLSAWKCKLLIMDSLSNDTSKCIHLLQVAVDAFIIQMTVAEVTMIPILSLILHGPGLQSLTVISALTKLFQRICLLLRGGG